MITFQTVGPLNNDNYFTLVYLLHMTGKKEIELLHNLGKQIKKARLAKGLSQKKISYTCAIEKSTISKIENGKVNISYFTLARLSECLEVKMKDLVAG